MNKYKVGDRVRTLKNRAFSDLNLPNTGIITGQNKSMGGYDFYSVSVDNGASYCLYEDEIAPLYPPKDSTPAAPPEKKFIEFSDIRVGDTIREQVTHPDGFVQTREGVVDSISGRYATSKDGNTISFNYRPRPSRSFTYELVNRPADPPNRVAELIETELEIWRTDAAEEEANDFTEYSRGVVTGLETALEIAKGE